MQIKPSTTRIVFHGQQLTGLAIMRTCRDAHRGGRSNTFPAMMLFFKKKKRFIQHSSAKAEEMSRISPRVYEWGMKRVEERA